jgi:hypothetical protein
MYGTFYSQVSQIWQKRLLNDIFLLIKTVPTRRVGGGGGYEAKKTKDRRKTKT